jgi:hypothetical protein
MKTMKRLDWEPCSSAKQHFRKDNLMIDKQSLQNRLKEAADHAQYKIQQAQQLLEKPNLSIEEMQSVSRVIDHLASVRSTAHLASYDCVG